MDENRSLQNFDRGPRRAESVIQTRNGNRAPKALINIQDSLGKAVACLPDIYCEMLTELIRLEPLTGRDKGP